MESRHHLSKSTVSATYNCRKCGRITPHRIDGGRKGPCMVCNPSVALKSKPVRQEPESDWPLACHCRKYPFPHHHEPEEANRLRKLFYSQLKVNQRA